MLQPAPSNVPPEVMASLPEPLRRFLSEGKTEIVADDGDWELELKIAPRDHYKAGVPQGSVMIANNGCGDRLFLVPKTGAPGQFESAVRIYWHEGPRIELFAADIQDLLYPPSPRVTSRAAVLYHDGHTPVQVGDEVTARDFFFRKPGRVIYVPGISKKNRDMEHHGLCWVGIKFASGSRTGTIVDPKTSRLKKSIHFVGRAAGVVEEMKPEERFE